jgi:hypothetical protein
MAWTLGELARNHSLTWTCLKKVPHASLEEVSEHIRSVERSYGAEGIGWSLW